MTLLDRFIFSYYDSGQDECLCVPNGKPPKLKPSCNVVSGLLVRHGRTDWEMEQRVSTHCMLINLGRRRGERC
jgi:hypothetical protein